jgi:hypothetical protein
VLTGAFYFAGIVGIFADLQVSEVKMAQPNRLPKLAQERGQTVTEMIADALKSAGSVAGAAHLIGVNPWTLTRWISLNGYEVEVRQEAGLKHAKTMTRVDAEAG